MAEQLAFAFDLTAAVLQWKPRCPSRPKPSEQTGCGCTSELLCRRHRILLEAMRRREARG